MRKISYRKKRTDPKIESIISKINHLDRLASYPVKDFAEKEGDADIIAEVCRYTLKPSQMRRFFDQSRRIQRDLTYGRKSWEEIAPQVFLLQPLLHYAESRNVIPNDFLNIMVASLGKIDVGASATEKRENFNRFMDFFQAIVAYHKYYNPRG